MPSVRLRTDRWGCKTPTGAVKAAPFSMIKRQGIDFFPLRAYNKGIEFLCIWRKNMAKKKTLQELIIKDNFLFGAVMVNEENCKEFLENMQRFLILM